MTDFFYSHLLSLLIVVPLLGAAGLFIVPRERIAALRILTLAVTTLNFILSLPLFLHFKDHVGDFQFIEQHAWIPSIGASFHLGVDGISLLMVMLTTLLMPLVILSSWTSIVQRVKEYMIVFLFLETAMVGVFASLDLLLFYVFWEAMLIPMYFIIGVWGGERRLYAAIKFFLFTMFGGVLMLVGILVLYFMHSQTAGVASFSYTELNQMIIGRQAQLWLFLAFGLAFAIKVPMVPFHTWLPDAHVEAPTGGSVILAGVLLKMGTYGFLRFCLPLFPDAAASLAPLIGLMAVIGIHYGALVSREQPDLKKLVAYSSVSHLGFVMLGLFSFNVQAQQGAVIQMVNHGLSTGALFLLVGMIYERRHTRQIADFGGLASVMPAFSTLFLIVTLSSIGLPGLNGFVGEFLILLGAFQAKPYLAVPATLGVILSAVYMLTMYQRVHFGKRTHEENNHLSDLTLREKLVLLPLLLFCFWIGLFPGTFLHKTEASVQKILTTMEMKQTTLFDRTERMSPAQPTYAVNEE